VEDDEIYRLPTRHSEGKNDSWSIAVNADNQVTERKNDNPNSYQNGYIYQKIKANIR
jgi:hypothetical protein